MALFDKAKVMISNLAKPGPRGFKGFAQGLKTGHKWGFQGSAPFVIGTAAYAAFTAPRGQAISKGIGGGLGFGVSSYVGGAIGGAIAGPPGAFVGAMVMQFLGSESLEKAVAGTIQPMVDFGANMRRHSFGGDYRDTQTASTMRQVAAREMSRSLMNARQWLGQESAFMHQ